MSENFLKNFEALCERVFSLLIKEYSLSVKEAESFRGVLYVVTFTNNLAGIECSYDLREGVFVDIVQLESLTKKNNGVANIFSIKILLRINNSDFKIDKKDLEKTRKNNIYDLRGVESVLVQYAEALKLYGQKVLTGDFSELAEEIKEIEERRKIYNTKVIYLPDSKDE